MQGKICLITGATSGIGFVTAQALAHQGATVVLVGRNPERAAAAVSSIQQATGNPHVACLMADLSVQDQVRQLAGEFQRRFARLDVLLNNAGAFFSRRSLSVDGLEMTLALNHLAYFLLTHLLLDTLNATPAARIVNVASDAHRNAQFDFTDPQGRQNYRGWRAYSQSKLANLLFTYELARRLADTDTTANAVHPGFVATRFGHNNRGLVGLFVWLAQFTALSPAQGAETLIYLATSPDAARVTGMYFVKKQPVGSSTASYDATAAQRLWQLSAELTGLA
jgi:NAD(P)-dependent dehydrogenase (short-subunit alcohol dehydrogenase family)